MQNPQETPKSRMAAAERLDNLYARLEIHDDRAAARKVKQTLDEARIKAGMPPAPDKPDESEDRINEVFDTVLGKGGSNARRS